MLIRKCFYIIGCLHIALSFCVSDTLRQQLQQQFNLYKASDYRPPINLKDFQKGTMPDRTKSQPAYEFAAFLLGYKEVVGVEGKDIQSFHQRSETVAKEVVKKADYYWYWQSPGHHTQYFIYTQKGRHNALLILESELYEHLSKTEHYYLMGKALGYPEEDIRFFIQRNAFFRIKKYFPENAKEPIKEFQDFLTNYWTNSLEQEYKSAKERIQYNIEQRSTADIEYSIEQYIRHNPLWQYYTGIAYDQPTTTLFCEAVQRDLIRG